MRRSLRDFQDEPTGEEQSSTDPDESGKVATESKEQARASSQSGNNEYGTPRWIIRKLHDAIGGMFHLDPAAGAEPTRIAETRYTEDDDGLSQSWRRERIDSIYLNPPYDDPYEWLEKLNHAVDPDEDKAADFAVALTKADTSTSWFHDQLTDAEFLAFPTSRISFYGGGSGASFANAFAIFGDPPKELVEELEDFCAIYTQVEVSSALSQQQLDDLVDTDGGPIVPATPAGPCGPTGPGGLAGSITAHGTKDAPLDFISEADEIIVELETDTLATLTEDIPNFIRVGLLPDGKTIDTETGTIRLDMAGETPDGNDVCASLRGSANIASDIELSIAIGMGRWHHVTPRAITVTG